MAAEICHFPFISMLMFYANVALAFLEVFVLSCFVDFYIRQLCIFKSINGTVPLIRYTRVCGVIE